MSDNQLSFADARFDPSGKFRVVLENGEPAKDGDHVVIDGTHYILANGRAVRLAGEWFEPMRSVRDQLIHERRCVRCTKKIPPDRAKNVRAIYCSHVCGTSASRGGSGLGDVIILMCRVCHKAFKWSASAGTVPCYCGECISSGLHRRDWHLQWKYDIGLWEAEAIVRAQLGVCPVCLDPVDVLTGVIDHDHSHRTGDRRGVRGVLHVGCNVTIGRLNDSGSSARRASEYLEHPPAPRVLTNGGP